MEWTPPPERGLVEAMRAIDPVRWIISLSLTNLEDAMDLNAVGIDVAKNVFQLFWVDRETGVRSLARGATRHAARAVDPTRRFG